MASVALLAVGALIGAAIAFAVNEALGRAMRGVDRRRAQKDPLVVHIEKDPSIIWAGAPPWVGGTYLLPADADLTAPPAHCPDWWAWAHARGGVDSTQTQLRLTLTARKSLLVVVDGLRVKIHDRRPVPSWRHVICGVGGADISPRRAEIELSGFDPPTVFWQDPEADGPVSAPTFSLAADEAEMLQIWANVGDDEWVEWTAEVLVLVDGNRRVVDISDDGKPFVTSGSAGAVSEHQRISGGGEWGPPIPSP